MFASDALSSVAYAPDEVFLTLSLAGASAYVWSWKIGIAVAIVMLTVVASYRQNVHAYPSGGGDYEVATVNLGQNAGVTVAVGAAGRLRPDRRGVDLLGRPERRVGDPLDLTGTRRRWRWLLVVVLAALNLRGVRESGAFFAIPTYGFMVGVIGMALVGAFRGRRTGTLPDVESAHDTIIPAPGYPTGGQPDRARPGLPARARLLVRQRGADRRRGDLERRPGLPQAEEQERRDHAAAARAPSRSRC